MDNELNLKQNETTNFYMKFLLMCELKAYINGYLCLISVLP
jgi:hypothetical protein